MLFLLSQMLLIVLVSAAIGAFLARVFSLCNCNAEELQEELRVIREERDQLSRRVSGGAGSAFNDAIGTRKAAALEAELAEMRSRADELAAANAKLRDSEGSDDDIAALKWRNKYLEARVLFFEGRESGGSVETPPMPSKKTAPRLAQVAAPDLEPVPLVAALPVAAKRGRRKPEPVLEGVSEPVAFVTAAAVPEKRTRKKTAAVIEAMVTPVATEAPAMTVSVPPKKGKAKMVMPPPALPQAISSDSFIPSPLADLSPEALEEALGLAGPGKAPPRSRRRANPDELLLIDGVGPKNKAWLNDQGIYYFHQIATMNIDQVAWLSRNLPTFGARVYRENWVAQCARLARGEPAR